MNKWIRRVAITTISSAFMIGAMATPSSAAPVAPAAECQVENVCILNNSTLVARLTEPIRPGNCSVMPASYNRMINYERLWQRMWTGRNCSGTSSLVGPGEDSGPHFGTRYWSVGGY